MLLCGPAISNRRISSSLFAREKIHRKHEETAEHTGRDRGGERVSALLWRPCLCSPWKNLTAQSWADHNIRNSMPQRCLDAWSLVDVLFKRSKVFFLNLKPAGFDEKVEVQSPRSYFGISGNGKGSLRRYGLYIAATCHYCINPVSKTPNIFAVQVVLIWNSR
jgi:hypothetical protein